MGTPSRLIGSTRTLPRGIALDLCRRAAPKIRDSRARHQIAAADTGLIEGKVTDELGKPLDGAVISALGGTTAFAVSDRTGQYTLRQLPPGPYLVRVHLAGFLAARSSMVT